MHEIDSSRRARFTRLAGPGRLLGGGGIRAGLNPLLAFPRDYREPRNVIRPLAWI